MSAVTTLTVVCLPRRVKMSKYGAGCSFPPEGRALVELGAQAGDRARCCHDLGRFKKGEWYTLASAHLDEYLPFFNEPDCAMISAIHPIFDKLEKPL